MVRGRDQGGQVRSIFTRGTRSNDCIKRSRLESVAGNQSIAWNLWVQSVVRSLSFTVGRCFSNFLPANQLVFSCSVSLSVGVFSRSVCLSVGVLSCRWLSNCQKLLYLRLLSFADNLLIKLYYGRERISTVTTRSEEVRVQPSVGGQLLLYSLSLDESCFCSIYATDNIPAELLPAPVPSGKTLQRGNLNPVDS